MKNWCAAAEEDIRRTGVQQQRRIYVKNWCAAAEEDIWEDINRRKAFSFGHCPNERGGGLPMPGFFGPLFLPSNSP